MFQFGGFASIAGYLVFNQVGCPIQTFADQWLFAPPHNFSQLITSFVASESLGILHAPLLTFFLHVVIVLFSSSFVFSVCQLTFFVKTTVENKGVEPLTSFVQGRPSSQPNL